jgi:uncharacterized protein (TIGR00369 family)
MAEKAESWLGTRAQKRQGTATPDAPIAPARHTGRQTRAKIALWPQGSFEIRTMAELPKDMPPAAVLLGREVLSYDAATGKVTLRFTARREFKNRHGTIQGGFLGAMLDSATGMAALTILSEHQTALTTSLDTVFYKPAYPGTIAATAKAHHIDDRSIEAKADLIAEDGALIASATARLRILPKRK